MSVTAAPAFTIGGSDAAAACGIDPFRSRAMLWAEKTGRIEREPTEAMRWGNLLEPVILQTLIADGYRVLPTLGETLSDPARPWLAGHPDALLYPDDESWRDAFGADGIAEIKTAGAWGAHDWQDGEAPPWYVVQLHHYFHLTGMARGILAVLIGGQRLEVREVERDELLIAAMIERETEMYGYLVRDECPPFEGSESDADVIRGLWPEAAPGKVVRLDRTGMALARDARLWHEAKSKATKRYDECVQRLQALAGDAEMIVSPADVPVAKWGNTSQSRVDVKRLRKEAPHVATTYTETTTARRFTLS